MLSPQKISNGYGNGLKIMKVEKETVDDKMLGAQIRAALKRRNIITVLCISFYVCLTVLFLFPKKPINITQSPALLKEFPTDDVCPEAKTKGQTFGTPSPVTNSFTLIFAGANSGTKDAISYSIASGYKVLFMSSTQIHDDFKQDLGDYSQTQLKVQDATRSCSEQVLQYIFQHHDISSIHLLFSERDFHKHRTSTQTAKLLECLIRFLNVFSHQPKKSQLRLHLPVSTQLTDAHYDLELWNNPTQEQLLQLMDDLHCKVRFNYKHNTDNILKTIQIYVTTFKRLYNLSLTTILS